MKFIKWLCLLAVLVIPTLTRAACTVSTPCSQTNWTNTSMAATVTNNSSGVETSGPGTAAIYRCTGTACGAPTVVPAANWTLLSSVIVQTTSAGSFIDTVVSYGVTYNYIVTNTWTGGGTSAPSFPFTLVMPTAPSTAPNSPTGGTAVIKTS